MKNPEQIYEVDAYADNELDPVRAIAVEKLMAEQPELRQRYDSILNLRRALREAAAQDRPSDLIQPRINRALGRVAPFVTRWAALAASFSLLRRPSPGSSSCREARLSPRRSSQRICAACLPNSRSMSPRPIATR